MGYRPQSQAFWVWDGEVTKLKWSGYIVMGYRAGSPRGIVLNLRKIQLKALFKTTPKTSKNTQELC